MRLQRTRTAFRSAPAALRRTLLVLSLGSCVAGEPASAGFNILHVGASASQCGVLRDLELTGGNTGR